MTRTRYRFYEDESPYFLMCTPVHWRDLTARNHASVAGLTEAVTDWR
jgi:hypothetical protein